VVENAPVCAFAPEVTADHDALLVVAQPKVTACPVTLEMLST
jgi:hypothetical protein